MKFEIKRKTGLKDIGKNALVKNDAILEILEDAAGEHTNKAGIGKAINIEKDHVAWILHDWKVKVLKRPIYADELTVKTWGRYFQKSYTYRDYEIYNSNGELAVIATSKWSLLNVETRKITKLTDDMRDAYQPEEVHVFDEEVLEKPEIPSEFSNSMLYTVSRRDIDLINHMHNIYYLDLAYEVLPEDVYEKRPFNEIRITYKHEIILGDKIECKYSYYNGSHVVILEKDNRVCAIITLK